MTDNFDTVFCRELKKIALYYDFYRLLKMYHKEGLPIEDFKIDARPCYCMKTTMHISDCEENCIFYSNGNTESYMSQLIWSRI